MQARAELAAFCDRLGGLPAALLVNSLAAFEGALAHLATRPPEELEGCAVGLYDYDPLAAVLQKPVHMMRQDSAALVARAFDLLDRGGAAPVLVEVAPELVPPRTLAATPFGDLG